MKKFKELVDRQMYEVIIQAMAGRRIVARETIKPFRTDVLAKLHASDISRRKKLLEKQKKGRKKLGGEYHDSAGGFPEVLGQVVFVV
ncbi:hypothetical protein GMDG_00456 [Pseudogymnoascus destructans 20631-21]|uniref:GTP-binding protein LepA C-terminal domain-containing protein n=2 Tax=Pseudogymnoascus destructans TaxID=655981 RepID=L8G3J6_PSED2|nr:hypothetical protein GMDG_00456 [Pseudogymnoascus destructans 20631-21]